MILSTIFQMAYRVTVWKIVLPNQFNFTAQARSKTSPEGRILIPSFSVNSCECLTESAMPHHGSMQTKSASLAAQIPRNGNPAKSNRSECSLLSDFNVMVEEFNCLKTKAS